MKKAFKLGLRETEMRDFFMSRTIQSLHFAGVAHGQNIESFDITSTF